MLPAQRRERGRVAVLRVMVVSLVLAAALLPLQAIQYFPLAAFPAELGLRVGALAVIAGATLALMTPGVVIALLLARLRPRWAVGVGTAWACLVALWLMLDRLVQGQTGNRLTYYYKFAVQPDAMRWAGHREGLVALFGQQGLYLGLYLAAAVLVAIAIARRVRRDDPAAEPRGLPALVAIWVLVLAAGPLVQRLTAEPRAFVRLNETMSVPWNFGFATAPDLLADTERRSAEIFKQYYDRLNRLPVVPAEVPPPAANPPNVIVIVVDGLRRDMFTPTVMPRLLAWSERGARFSAHFSAANGSEWGTFGMLYGLTPFSFVPIVTSGVPPTLLSVLWRWGYQTHFVTSGADFGWLLIGRFLGPDFFTVHTQPPDRVGWENDRDSVAVARDVLASGGAPKFLFVWLAATHWAYSSPDEYRPFMPDNIVPPDTSRPFLQRVWVRSYTRAARYIDDLLGGWLEGVDLTRNLIVLTADHGEGLYDDGFVGHGSRLSSAQVQVPFVIAGPGVAPHTVVDQPTGNFDVAPTLLALLGDSADAEQTMFGTPLLPGSRQRPPYTLVYQPVDESAVGDLASLSSTNALREVLFSADGVRFGIRLDPTQPAVSSFGLMDNAGAVTSDAITAAQAETFLGWFEESLARSARIDGGAAEVRAPVAGKRRTDQSTRGAPPGGVPRPADS